jgi:hypothetical protein
MGAPLWSKTRMLVGGDEKSRGIERHPPANMSPPARTTAPELNRMILADERMMSEAA